MRDVIRALAVKVIERLDGQAGLRALPHPCDPAWTIAASSCERCGQEYIDAVTRRELQDLLRCPDCGAPLRFVGRLFPELFMPLEEAERYADRLIDSGWPYWGSKPTITRSVDFT